MAEIDNGLVFCSAQALTATALATYSIPLTTARPIFQGEQLAVFVQVGVAADFTTGDETYTFQVQSDDNAAISSGTTVSSRAILATALLINTVHTIPVPQEATMEAYLGLNFVLAGTTPTITVTAWLGQLKDAPAWSAIQDAITIS